jgi:hypothetical protein
MFYASPSFGQASNIKVTTFNGTFVAEASRAGRMLAFVRGGRRFRGVIRKDADCVWFKRVS